MNLSEKINDKNLQIRFQSVDVEDIQTSIRRIRNKISAKVDFKTEKDYEECMNIIGKEVGDRLSNL